MKKTFKLDEIDCANCALKLEEALRKVDGVQDVKVNFLSQKLTLAAADDAFDSVLKQVVKTARKSSCKTGAQGCAAASLPPAPAAASYQKERGFFP